MQHLEVVALVPNRNFLPKIFRRQKPQAHELRQITAARILPKGALNPDDWAHDLPQIRSGGQVLMVSSEAISALVNSATSEDLSSLRVPTKGLERAIEFYVIVHGAENNEIASYRGAEKILPSCLRRLTNLYPALAACEDARGHVSHEHHDLMIRAKKPPQFGPLAII